MKRLICIIAIMCLIISSFTLSVVADNSNMKITSVTYTSTDDVYSLTINGLCTPGNNISLLVKNKNDGIKAMEQYKIKSNAGTSFTFDIDVSVSGDELLKEEDDSYIYTVYVKDYNNNSAQYTVTLFTESSKNTIVSILFNNVTETDKMLEYIEKYSSVFGFDTTYYTADVKTAVAEYMIANASIEPFSIDNVVEKYNDSVIRSYLFADDKTADLAKIIEYNDYSKMLKFGDFGTIYSEYKKMKSKEKVNELAFTKENSMKDFEKVREIFYMAVTAVVFDENKEDLTTVCDFVDKNNCWFNLANYSDLQTYEKSTIFQEIILKGVPDNKNDFVNLYNAEYAILKGTDIPVETPVTGGGGGGGTGGGNIGNIADDVGYEPQDNPVDLKPVEKTVFNDLDGYDWAKDAINVLALKGIVNGRNNSTFAPADYITREEFSKILAIAFDLYDENASTDFVDVEDNRWSYAYISSMYKNGVITGYPDGSFKPNSFVTREEMTVMLHRALVRIGRIETEYESYSSYKDFNDISSFAVNSVLTLSNQGILSGDDTGKFNPKKGATRAEVCKMIYNTGL